MRAYVSHRFAGKEKLSAHLVHFVVEFSLIIFGRQGRTEDFVIEGTERYSIVTIWAR